MTKTVAVAGATGYAGSEILRLLLNHPLYQSGELVIGSLTAASSAGRRVSELMPHLTSLRHHVIEPTTPAILSAHDIVFLALPHGHSAAIARELPEDTLVLDCAADFRLIDAAAWEHYYGSPHAGSWAYGIPEMPGHREAIAATRRVAIPGCFPTGATLAVLPAVTAGLIEPDLVVTSITGVSGAGKKASVPMLGSEVMGSLKAYNTAGAHRHTPEIVQNVAEYIDAPVTVSFTPVLAPLQRGILSTVTAPLASDITDEEARAAYTTFYASEPVVTVCEPGEQPSTQNVLGANACHVQVQVDATSGRLLMISAIDNLVKGTAGAAIQCMNVALGANETAGLPREGIAP